MSRKDDRYHIEYYGNSWDWKADEKITAADVAKIILGSIITIGGFYSLTVILFTL